MNTYKASCSCGRISYYFSTAIAPANWPVRTCSCSFCTARDPVYAADPNGSVRFDYADAGEVVKHRFATGTADFVSCRQCGDYMGAVTVSGEGAYAVLNVRQIGQDLDLGQPQTMSFDAESADQRLARRCRHWTPVAGDV